MRKFVVSREHSLEWLSENDWALDLIPETEIPAEVKELRSLVEQYVPQDTNIYVHQRLSVDGTIWKLAVHCGPYGYYRFTMGDYETSTVSDRAEWVKGLVRLLVDSTSDDPEVNSEARKRLLKISFLFGQVNLTDGVKSVCEYSPVKTLLYGPGF